MPFIKPQAVSKNPYMQSENGIQFSFPSNSLHRLKGQPCRKKQRLALPMNELTEKVSNTGQTSSRFIGVSYILQQILAQSFDLIATK